MPDSLAPVSEAITNSIRVEVMSRYSSENSKPQQGMWVFQYTVRITNLSQDAVQLLSRHWIVTDALDRVEEIQGGGVVGQMPVIAPGQSFQYSSWCPLKTPSGNMRGTYEIVGPGGTLFDIEIAPFALRSQVSLFPSASRTVQ
ncbi:MAG TPA: Co2+/Mg2+ efflux protein ApaG [Bryobacteraceae bacterium]|nr:Co2+/Mg2+ efflux protein ApaG [Bryobacteraceae bacterium]